MKNHFICTLLSILIVNLCGFISNNLLAEEWDDGYYHNGVFIDGVYYNLSPYDSEEGYYPAVVAPSAESSFEYSGNIVIPASVYYNDVLYKVTAVGIAAFSDCKDLFSVSLPEGLARIEPAAFRRCSNLKKVVIPNSVTYFGEDSFLGCGITSVNIPSSMTYISDVFGGCSDLVSVSIPNSITKIGSIAFWMCSRLQSVTIPKSVETIERSAFRETGLVSVTVERETPPSIYQSTFEDVNKSNCILYVPYGSKSAYESHEYWGEFKNIIEMSTDITSLDNAIYVEPTDARIGGTKDISIKLKNDYAASGFQFTLEVPEGVTINSWSLSEDRLPSGATTGDKVSSYSIDGNKISVACALNYDGESFTGSDGEIATVNVTIGEDMAEAFYPLFLTTCDVTSADGKDLNLNNTQSTLTLDSYVVGDANGDGVVRIGDATTILNYIVGNPSANFKEKAADANGDGQVRIGDVTTVLNIIVGK